MIYSMFALIYLINFLIISFLYVFCSYLQKIRKTTFKTHTAFLSFTNSRKFVKIESIKRRLNRKGIMGMSFLKKWFPFGLVEILLKFSAIKSPKKLNSSSVWMWTIICWKEKVPCFRHTKFIISLFKALNILSLC